ncbi:hypothetical protein D8674_017171 [Pyrus ussuriensis x Pyrus communis]|uniref:Uncharacterized protein n=1 Tax=Pyrus ussuriensis x Pyrus communis TaxID=2448454 RepID=A0A5N5HH49_9ROSA|nr:hypothetical protein D8674_017171 [Pyrus ussuriensis x Pyrus communis]
MDHLGGWNTVLMLETEEQLAIVDREAGGSFDASPSALPSPGKAAVAAARGEKGQGKRERERKGGEVSRLFSHNLEREVKSKLT